MFGNQFSLMNYDTLSTNPWNCMNLHMNQVACDMQVWPSLFQTQTYSFNNYIPYGGSYSNSYLTDPMYTIRQASWGTPAWNNNLWNNPMNGGWNWTPWGNNGITSGSSSSNSSDPEEIKHSEKYNKLKKLVEQLEKYEYLSNEEKRTLSAALKDTKGTNQEKFEKLLKAYNSIGKDKVEDFLVNANGLAVKDTSTTEGKDTSKNNFYYQLTQAGFEYKNKTMDDEVENFYNSIKNELKENSGKAEKACAVVNALDNSNILDFISSYNSNYKADALFEHIGNNWKKVKGEMATSVSSQIIDPLADKLIAKAQEVSDYLDDDAQDEIKKAIEELETAKSKSKKSVNSNLSSAFNRLYLLTRLGATAKLRNDAIAYYGEIDSKVFDDKLFNKKVTKDLIDEGFDKSAIEEAQVSVSDREARRASRAKGEDDVEETPEEKAKRLEEEEKKKAEREKKKAEEKIEARRASRADGLSLNTYLTGWSFDNESSIAINDILEGVDKDNIMALLEGYYIDAGKAGAKEGLLERLDDEYDGGTISMDNKKKIVTSLLEVAEEVGLKDSPEYKKIKSIMNKYEEGHSCEAKNTFNNGGLDRLIGSDGALSAVNSWVKNIFVSPWIGLTTDNEVLDKQIESLFQKIKSIKASN